MEVLGIKQTNGFETFSMSQNYPNPFNPSTKVDFTVPKTANVSMIYDLRGREIKSLIHNQSMLPGKYNG